ncbi:MAG: SufD family Fe-S cluster assembly protein [Candidatus Magasanikbacteria bacterium]|nr:SufD family Fe-S cluster assembly protein [Candidatus Magasanikbacteria bacterium]
MKIETISNFSKPLTIQANKQVCYFLNTIPSVQIHLKKNSHLTLIALVTDGWEDERKLAINTQERGATCQLIVFILGKNNTTYTAKIQGIHHAPGTGIKAKIRTALTDKSTCRIDGDWVIEKKAKGTDTHFAAHTLILSEEAAAKTSPNLEIKTDDVKAGHSASVGKIDEDALFYLLSRGIDEAGARALMVQGFFETEINHVADENTKEIIREAIKKFLS